MRQATFIGLLAAITLSLPAASVAATAELRSASASQELEFDVYLDDSKIGYHRFDITRAGDGSRQVVSEAKFDVKFLFITAFRYRHENNERWVDGCLAEIESDTNSNGKKVSVDGMRGSTGLKVDRGGELAELPGCVMTFAYWNPEFLQQSKLLNPQTGEYLDVDIQKLDTTTLAVNGQDVEATAYSITARGVEVKVWYSPENEWLALESKAKGDRTIRYELS